MNRRTFLKLTGATAILAATPLTFAEKKETPQWVRLADQLPSIGQKIVMCDMTGSYTTVWYGYVKNNDIQLMGGNRYVPYSLMKWEYYEHYDKRGKRTKKVLPTVYKTTIGKFGITPFYGGSNSCRYWLPVEGEFPKTLPPFPSRASKWIAFKDQMPPRNEEIEVRDQNARTAKGWYVTSKTVGYPNSGTDDYFMPCEEDNKWLHISAIQVNKSYWDWRYV